MVLSGFPLRGEPKRALAPCRDGSTEWRAAGAGRGRGSTARPPTHVWASSGNLAACANLPRCRDGCYGRGDGFRDARRRWRRRRRRHGRGRGGGARTPQVGCPPGSAALANAAERGCSPPAPPLSCPHSSFLARCSWAACPATPPTRASPATPPSGGCRPLELYLFRPLPEDRVEARLGRGSALSSRAAPLPLPFFRRGEVSDCHVMEGKGYAFITLAPSPARRPSWSSASTTSTAARWTPRRRCRATRAATS